MCVSASRLGPHIIHISCAARRLSDTDGPVGMQAASVTCCRALPVTATRSLVRTTVAFCLHYQLPYDCRTLRSTTDYDDDNDADAGDDGDDYDHGDGDDDDGDDDDDGYMFSTASLSRYTYNEHRRAGTAVWYACIHVASLCYVCIG